MSIRVFGIQIERKTDILAFAAFLISLLGVATQAAFFVRGADVELFVTEQVLLMGDKIRDEKYARIAARMTYVNRGQVGYNDILRQELVRFKIGNTEYEHYWQDYTSSKEEGGKLSMNIRGDALPVAINAGSSESHETFFAPRWVTQNGVRSGKNYIQWDKFLTTISAQNEIVFVFRFKTFLGKEGEAACKIVVDSNLIENLKKRGWSVRSCA